MEGRTGAGAGVRTGPDDWAGTLGRAGTAGKAGPDGRVGPAGRTGPGGRAGPDGGTGPDGLSGVLMATRGGSRSTARRKSHPLCRSLISSASTSAQSRSSDQSWTGVHSQAPYACTLIPSRAATSSRLRPSSSRRRLRTSVSRLARTAPRVVPAHPGRPWTPGRSSPASYVIENATLLEVPLRQSPFDLQPRGDPATAIAAMSTIVAFHAAERSNRATAVARPGCFPSRTVNLPAAPLAAEQPRLI